MIISRWILSAILLIFNMMSVMIFMVSFVTPEYNIQLDGVATGYNIRGDVVYFGKFNDINGVFSTFCQSKLNKTVTSIKMDILRNKNCTDLKPLNDPFLYYSFYAISGLSIIFILIYWLYKNTCRGCYIPNDIIGYFIILVTDIIFIISYSSLELYIFRDYFVYYVPDGSALFYNDTSLIQQCNFTNDNLFKDCICRHTLPMHADNNDLCFRMINPYIICLCICSILIIGGLTFNFITSYRDKKSVIGTNNINGDTHNISTNGNV